MKLEIINSMCFYICCLVCCLYVCLRQRFACFQLPKLSKMEFHICFYVFHFTFYFLFAREKIFFSERFLHQNSRSNKFNNNSCLSSWQVIFHNFRLCAVHLDRFWCSFFFVVYHKNSWSFFVVYKYFFWRKFEILRNSVQKLIWNSIFFVDFFFEMVNVFLLIWYWDIEVLRYFWCKILVIRLWVDAKGNIMNKVSQCPTKHLYIYTFFVICFCFLK